MTLGRGHSLPAAIWGDAILTLTLSPLALVAFVGITIATVSGAALDGLLPIVFAVLAILLSDIATRDRRAGTTAILYAAPRLREHFVWWKLGSALVLGLLLCAAPIARIAWHGLPSIVALLVGIFFVVALATALGVITANAKTFIVLFLSFWYVVFERSRSDCDVEFGWALRSCRSRHNTDLRGAGCDRPADCAVNISSATGAGIGVAASFARHSQNDRSPRASRPCRQCA